MSHLKYIFWVIAIFDVYNILCLGPYGTAPPHTVTPRVKSTTNKYTPTNAWFENLLLNKGESPVQTYPYQIKAKHSGLSISYSGLTHLINTPNFVLEGNIDNLVLSIRETFPESLIDVATVNADFFDIGVKINYGSQFDVVLVRGSASIVANFRSVKPVFKTIHAITNAPTFPELTKSLKVTFNNGQTWLIQSQSQILWAFSGTEFSAQLEYTGWLKISICLSSQTETSLLSYADQSPITNGKVSYSVDRSSSPGTVTVNLEYNNAGLFYLLPHIYKLGQTGANIINGATVKGVKGVYFLASGKGYQYKLPVINNSDNSKAFDSNEKKSKLLDALKGDVQSLNLTVRDPYFGGKELARAANLIEIADHLGDNVSKNKIKDALTKELDDFWFGFYNGSTALVYEPTWGGIVSRNSIGDPGADFGQYYYNDHHFHYGYFINTAATLAKHYPAYYASRSEFFEIIMADFAGTCKYPELPCKTRAKDPFLGHSYAAGIFEFADSRNQESTSESINAYFAVRELAKAINDTKLLDLGDYLVSTEIYSSQIYWQIKKSEDIYTSPFKDNGVVGILWETKVDYATFFGLNVEYIYGIQMLPYNDITLQFLDKNWLRETKPKWGVALENSATTEEWKGLLLLADAIVDPLQYGLSTKIHNLVNFDNGNSKTNTLYFYYMAGGTPSETGNPVTNPATNPVTNPGGSTMVTSIPPGDCNDISCIIDQGVPSPSYCAVLQLGCFSVSGSFTGCYEPTVSTCFYGGSICPKPLLACVNYANPSTGAACYNSSLYKCSSGNLVFIG